eukprot:5364735-Amphidinium_carterae.1
MTSPAFQFNLKPPSNPLPCSVLRALKRRHLQTKLRKGGVVWAQVAHRLCNSFDCALASSSCSGYRPN